MSKTETITLSSPINGHAGLITSVVVREPKFGEIMQLGRPFEWHRGPDGTPVYVENNEAIAGYAERCVVEPKDGLLLEQLGVEDTLAIREVLLGFFLPKSTGGAVSKT